MKKNIKLFPVFMFPFFMWAIGVAFNSPQKAELKSQIEFHLKQSNPDLSHFQTIELEEGEFVIIESEPEFEIELDWFSIPAKSFNILQSSLKENSNSNLTLFFTSKETIPLYDLYCNWKFHLS